MGCDAATAPIPPGPAASPEDILLWSGGFWCFREEFAPEMLRGDNYRVILRNSHEWLSY
jgi:hypothetical protein